MLVLNLFKTMCVYFKSLGLPSQCSGRESHAAEG